jgi:hypothetical protein
MPKKKKAKRDIEKGYTTKQMVAKLRRLADCLERGKRFQIQIAGERILVPAATFNIEHGRGSTMEEVEFQFKLKHEWLTVLYVFKITRQRVPVEEDREKWKVLVLYIE